jgi:hypothetical protein
MPDCPTPGKKDFAKKDAQTFVNAHPERGRLRIYPCACGWWHITHKPITWKQDKSEKPLKMGNRV